MITVWENFLYLLQIYQNPQRAFGNIIDRGSWIFGAVAVLLVSFAFGFAVNYRLQKTFVPARFNFETYQQPNAVRDLPDRERLSAEQIEEIEIEAAYQNYQQTLRERRRLPIVGDAGLWFFSFNSNGFLSLLLALAVFYVPATVLLLTFFEPVGSFRAALARDYATLLACTLAAWAAAHLPFALIGLTLVNQAVDPNVLLVLWAASGLYFGALMVFAVRTVFGASWRGAIATVCLSWLAITFGNRVFAYVSPFLFSPFILIFAFMYFRGAVGDLNNSFRGRQNFRRFLNNAAINQHDAEVRVQLGLIHRNRRQTSEAERYFAEAIAIDSNEIDANYELGKIRREFGDLEAALKHFAIVAEQNDRFATDEIWREIGATYLAANALPEAAEFLEKYVTRRSHDPEGLYLFGQTLQQTGDQTRAREMFERCIESVKTSPDYRRGQQRKWAQLARKALA